MKNNPAASLNLYMLSWRAPQISIHIVCCLLFMIFPLLFMHNGKGYTELIAPAMHYSYWLFCSCYIILFYFNRYYLMPRFFIPGRYGIYVAMALLLCGGIFFLQPFDRLLQQKWAVPPEGADWVYESPVIDITSLFIFFMIMALGAAITTTRRWQLTEQRAIRAEREKIRAELSFLKAQVHPHFLFNTLNNIYTLALTKNNYTADSILRLSNIMRYITDDVCADYVPLLQEEECIRDYIALQQLRLRPGLVDYKVTGELERKVISPLVLMTFVENMFKYGVSKHMPAPMLIHLEISEHHINFFCRNRIYRERKPVHSSGVGIANTRQRLELLYPQKHVLNITTDNNLYTVRLTLQID
ncbi:sensor histidine kinase [Chitinophaga sp. HK235]|uniref:sensor histidine kinase n=1 Tax=Chitinophaga sp. HK235 TaxID=2952571 RepID=UPI001BA55970|nr:sensor histidine kinase [Chitinophaga sp. HK235]